MPTNVVVVAAEPRPGTEVLNMRLVILEIFLGVKILMKSLKW